MNNFGEYIRKVRKKEDLTLTELAEIFKSTHAHLSNIENGNRKPNTELLEKYSAHFHIDIRELLFRMKLDEIDLIERDWTDFVFDSSKKSHTVTSWEEEQFFFHPARYHIMKLRLLSLKTFDEILEETGLSIVLILKIEKNGTDSIDELNNLGRAYGIQNLFKYLNIEIGNDKGGVNLSNKAIDRILWWGIEEDEEKIKEYLTQLEDDELKHEALKQFQLNESDLLYKLSKPSDLYFGNKKLSKLEKFKALKLLEYLFKDENELIKEFNNIDK